MKGDLRFVVPALAGSSFIPPKGGTTNVSRRSMQYPGEFGPCSLPGPVYRAGFGVDFFVGLKARPLTLAQRF